MEQGEAKGVSCLGRRLGSCGNTLAAREEKTVLLAECFEHGLMAGLADQFADPAVAAGIAGLRALRAGNDDDAVGARPRRLNSLGVGARYVEILQRRGLAFGDGDQGARHGRVGQPDIGQHHDVDRAGRRVAFNVGAGIDAGADGVAFGTCGRQHGDGQRAVALGDYGQIVEVGGRGHAGERRLFQSVLAGDLPVHMFGVGLAAAAVLPHEAHAQRFPEQRVAGMVHCRAGLKQAVGGGQRAPRSGEADEEDVFPKAIAFTADDLRLCLNIGRDVDFRRADGGGQK